MKRKFKFLMAGIIALGLLVAGTASALAAGPGAESIGGLAETNEMSAEELGALIAELEAEDIDIVPAPGEGAEVAILGGFHGKWGVDETEGNLGWLAGIYGSVNYEDGTGYGFIGGVWKMRGEKVGGYIIGKYADGAFWGIYRNYAGENGGSLSGTYAVGEEDVEAIVNRFEGQWISEDGEREGHIEGTWAQKVDMRCVGRFGGAWYYNDEEAELVEAAEVTEAEVTKERPEADGKLRGFYGAMRLADDTVIHLFRGGWTGAEGAEGKLFGIGARGRFYGVWNGEECSGYLMGKARDHHFRGVWGTFGEEAQGRLVGRYGRHNRTNEAEPGAVDSETIPQEEEEAQGRVRGRHGRRHRQEVAPEEVETGIETEDPALVPAA